MRRASSARAGRRGVGPLGSELVSVHLPRGRTRRYWAGPVAARHPDADPGRSNPAVAVDGGQLVPATVQVPLRAQQGGEVAGALALATAWASWAPIADAYSWRSTSRNTPNGVGEWSSCAQPGEGEGQARIVALGVVDEDRVLADVGDVDEPQLAVGAHHDAALAVGAEADRLAVHEVDHHLVAGLLLGDVVELAVVEHVAVLVDLDERRAAVVVGGPERSPSCACGRGRGCGRRSWPRRRARRRAG